MSHWGNKCPNTAKILPGLCCIGSRVSTTRKHASGVLQVCGPVSFCFSRSFGANDTLGCSVAYFFTFLGSWVPSILQLTLKSMYFFQGVTEELSTKCHKSNVPDAPKILLPLRRGSRRCSGGVVIRWMI